MSETRPKANRAFRGTYNVDPADGFTHVLDPSDPMVVACEWLRARRIPHAPLTDHQIKIGASISYYPHRGTFYVDGSEHSIKWLSLDALGDLLREHGFTL